MDGRVAVVGRAVVLRLAKADRPELLLCLKWAVFSPLDGFLLSTANLALSVHPPRLAGIRPVRAPSGCAG